VDFLTMTDAAELVKLADGLPTRLRGFVEDGQSVPLSDALEQAADEIERLRAALAAQQDGAVSFGAEECYILFLLADTEARHLRGRNDAISALREKLLPAYRDWHGANPHKVHPHSTLVCEQLEQLRRDEQ
jgi:hypothetical protein